MNTLKKITCLLFSILLMHSVSAQDADGHLSSLKGENTLGIGLGLPYGGIGFRVGSNIADELNLFGGFGYQVAGLGYNFGIMKDFASSRQAQFYLTGMFGTNAAIKVEGLSEYNKTYLGLSFGLGVKVNSRKKEGNYWDLGLLLPLTSSQFKADERTVENDPRVSDFRSASPVLIVIGYNFNL